MQLMIVMMSTILNFFFYKNAANLLFIGTGLRSDLRKSAMRGKFSILLINSTKLGNFPINSGDNF